MSLMKSLCLSVSICTFASNAHSQSIHRMENPEQILESLQSPEDVKYIKGKRHAEQLMNLGAHTLGSVPLAGGALKGVMLEGAKPFVQDVEKREALAYRAASLNVYKFSDLPAENFQDNARALILKDPELQISMNLVGTTLLIDKILEQRDDETFFAKRVRDSELVLTKSTEKIISLSDNLLSYGDKLLDEDGNVNPTALDQIKSANLDTYEAYLVTQMAIKKAETDLLKGVENDLSNDRDFVASYTKRFGGGSALAAESILKGEKAAVAADLAYRQTTLNTNILLSNSELLSDIDYKTDNIQSGTVFQSFNDFRQLSPDEQLDILNGKNPMGHDAMFGHLVDDPADPDDRYDRTINTLTESAKKQKSRENLVEGVETARAVVGGIQVIGELLEWEFTQTEDFQKGAQYFNVAAGLALSGGNPMAIVGALSGLTGGSSGPSAGEQMILAKLAKMDKKLDDLLKGQDEIKSLIEIKTNEIKEMQFQTLEKLDDVNSGIYRLQHLGAATIRNVLDSSQLSRQLKSCDAVVNQMQAKGWYLSPKLDQMNEIISASASSNTFMQCSLAIDSLWDSNVFEKSQYSKNYSIKLDKFNANIAMISGIKTSATGEQKSDVLEINDKVWKPLLELMWSEYDVEISANRPTDYEMVFKLIAALSEPNFSLESFGSSEYVASSKATAAKSIWKQDSLRERFFEDFTDLLDPVELVRVTEHYITMMPFMDLTKDIGDGSSDSYKLFSTEELSEVGNAQRLKNISSKIESQFNHNLHALNVAIAQQNLLSGDYLSPKIGNVIFSTGYKNHELRNKLLIALEENPTLSKNVLISYINGQLVAQRNIPERYLDEVRLDGSDKMLTNQANWANNLALYQQLHLAETNTDFVPKNERWTKIESASNTDLCSEDNINWSCILPSNFRIIDNKIVFEKTIFRDGKIVNAGNVELGLPTAAELETKKTRPKASVADLITVREKLLNAGNLMNVSQPIPEISSIWILPRDSFIN